MMFRTAKEIFTHLTTKYSVLNAEDFETLRLRFAMTKTAAEEVSHVADRHREGHAICLAAGQPVNEFNKCSAFKLAISTDPACRNAVQSYTQLHPLLPNQIFVDLVQHVLLHAPNYVATTADLGFALAATTNLTGNLPATNGRGGRGGGPGRGNAGRNNSNRGGRGGGGNASIKYCYYHGHQMTHEGPICTHIMLSHPADFNPAQINAHYPSEIPGGSSRFYSRN
jgi:hypothetical protein